MKNLDIFGIILDKFWIIGITDNKIKQKRLSFDCYHFNLRVLTIGDCGYTIKCSNVSSL